MLLEYNHGWYQLLLLIQYFIVTRGVIYCDTIYACPWWWFAWYINFRRRFLRNLANRIGFVNFCIEPIATHFYICIIDSTASHLLIYIQRISKNPTQLQTHLLQETARAFIISILVTDWIQNKIHNGLLRPQHRAPKSNNDFMMTKLVLSWWLWVEMWDLLKNERLKVYLEPT